MKEALISFSHTLKTLGILAAIIYGINEHDWSIWWIGWPMLESLMVYTMEGKKDESPN